jgi:hypothetical protein
MIAPGQRPLRSRESTGDSHEPVEVKAQAGRERSHRGAIRTGRDRFESGPDAVSENDAAPAATSWSHADDQSGSTRRTDGKPGRATMTEAFEPDPICPVCHEGRLTPTYEGWYVLPSAGYPKRNQEGGFEEHRGLQVGVRSCSACEHVALFLPPTLDASGQPHRPGRSRRDVSRAGPGGAASGGDAMTPEVHAALMLGAERAITREDRELLEAIEAAYRSLGLKMHWDHDAATGKLRIGTPA